MLNESDVKHVQLAEQTSMKWNIGLKALSIFMFMNIRIGFSPRRFSFVNRPVGRSWLYDFGLMYLGTYSFLLSHIIGIR